MDEPQIGTIAKTQEGKVTRRRLLKQLGLGLAGVSLGGAGYVFGIEPHWVDFHTREMPLKNLPRGLEGRTVVQLSDLHIGPVVDDDYLLDVYRRTAELKPDFVVMTGDFLTLNKGRIPREQMIRNLTHFPHGKLGTYAVLGNHDFGHRWKDLPAADDVATIVRDAGMTVLRNECIETHGLLLAGVDDYWTSEFRPGLIAKHFDPAAPTLLLCHNPDAMDANLWGAFEGWVLSGHTHGGQVRLPGYSAPVVPVRNKNYIAGEVQLGGGRTLYVNRGVGYSIRARMASRPEVTVFRLRESV